MLGRFARLRHHAVIGRNDDDDDIGDLRATRTHARERRMAWRVEEGDDALLGADVIRANMLGDATSLDRGDAGFAAVIEPGRLAVLDVAHYGDARRKSHAIAIHLRPAGYRLFMSVLQIICLGHPT